MTPDLTRDAFLGGRLQLWQPRDGYRAGIDPVLLAAACPAREGESVLDLGCGVGTALFCVMTRVEGVAATGLELQADYVELAQRNAADNGFSANILQGDITDLPGAVRQKSFDHVIMNPPFFDRRQGHEARNAGRNVGRGGDAALAVWIDVAIRRLRHGGTLSIIQTPARLGEIIRGLDDRVGATSVRPIAPRAGRDATLVLVLTRKGRRTPMRIAAPLILHQGPRHMSDGEDYRPEVSEILRNADPLTI